MSSLLVVDRVSKSFAGHSVLKEVGLEVQQGEFIALLGPSGCGKTTLLRTIAGFIVPDSGRVAIDGADVVQLPPHKRPLNTVFQNYALFPHLRVSENVAYGPRRAGVSRAEADIRAAEALTMVDMGSFARRFPRELSGGQQQRVALARAIVNRPRLLLLDEPLSALDLKLRKKMQLELKRLQAALGIAFIFVTHDQEEAMTMADRVVVMNNGEIEQVGTSQDIYQRPATKFVAEFVGEANFIQYIRTGAGEVQLDLFDGPVQLSKDVPKRGVAVVRPEALRIVAPSTDMRSSPCQVIAQIDDVLNLGSHEVLYATAGDRQLIVRGPVRAQVEARGTSVCVEFDPDALHFIAEG